MSRGIFVSPKSTGSVDFYFPVGGFHTLTIKGVFYCRGVKSATILAAYLIGCGFTEEEYILDSDVEKITIVGDKVIKYDVPINIGFRLMNAVLEYVI